MHQAALHKSSVMSRPQQNHDILMHQGLVQKSYDGFAAKAKCSWADSSVIIHGINSYLWNISFFNFGIINSG
jgi:hypothetical protein